MSTLLMRLTAPLQAWGGESKYDIRKTEREPTKSGVIGMAAAALGRRRDEAVGDLAALRFGVRVDREGELLTDFHMVHAGGKNPASYVTTRHYLADAIFLVGLEGDTTLLKRLESAFAAPAFPLSLGRRSCPPEGRICLGIRDAELTQALRVEPWLLPVWRRPRLTSAHLRLLTDAPDPMQAKAVRRDLPVSFDQSNRRYIFRALVEWPPVPVGTIDFPYGGATEHDPMSGLDGDVDVSVPNRA